MTLPSRMSPAAFLLAGLCACTAPRPSEFVNITFTPSVDTDDYETWDFELDSCRDFDDPRIDGDSLRVELLASIEEELTKLGYERLPGHRVDFTVFYELEVVEDGSLPGVQERWRGRIFVRDVATGRLVWRGERKAPVTGEASTPEPRSKAVHRFVSELLRYTQALEEPEHRG